MQTEQAFLHKTSSELRVVAGCRLGASALGQTLVIKLGGKLWEVSCFWVRQMIERRPSKSKSLSDLLRAPVFTYDAPNQPATGGVQNMSDRKYRHRGYMDNDREPQQSKPQQQQKPRDREGPRSPKMMAFGDAVKCSS